VKTKVVYIPEKGDQVLLEGAVVGVIDFVCKSFGSIKSILVTTVETQQSQGYLFDKFTWEPEHSSWVHSNNNHKRQE
jgi:hypothetical protein